MQGRSECGGLARKSEGAELGKGVEGDGRSTSLEAGIGALGSGATVRRVILGNIGANYVGAVINAALPLLTLPLFFNALGAERWGLVSFVTFFVSALSILDSGFSQGMVKEFAGREGRGSGGDWRPSDLLFGYERLYCGFALVVTVLVLPFSEAIASRWLELGSFPAKDGVRTIYCGLALFLVQFPGSIYRTVLVARQQQVLLNKVQIGFVFLRHGVGVALVSIWPAIELYLLWLVVCSCLETLVMATRAWREVGQTRRESKWNSGAMRSTVRLAGVMAVTVLLGMASTMIDKLFISAKLPIAELGYYGIASSVAFGALRLTYPVFTAVVPHMAQVGCDERATGRINRRLLVASTGGVLVFVVLYVLAGKSVLSLWLGSESALENVYPIVNILLVGCALNVYYNIGYSNWVAAGVVKPILAVNVASLCLAWLLTPVALDRFGLAGGAAARVAMNAIGAAVAIAWLLIARKRTPLETHANSEAG
jgi:O-antigen/teichoic acid export membrane protein